MPIALRLNKRIDGSYVVVDTLGRGDAVRDGDGNVIGDNRAFPDVHWFRYSYLAEHSDLARLDGDQVILELANGRAVYRITERQPNGVAVELVESELVDPAPLDEAKAAANRAAKEERAAQALAAGQAGEGSVAHAGRAVIRDEDGQEITEADVADVGAVLGQKGSK